MNVQSKLFAVIMMVFGGLTVGFWSHSWVDGIVVGISLFNMFVLMGMTAETY